MRDRLLRLGEPTRDRLAHHAERPDLGGRELIRTARRGVSGYAVLRASRGAIEIARDDATAGAAARDAAQVEIELARARLRT